jgi:Pectate lyase superfamily protein
MATGEEKISQLPGAATLTGSEELPIVQNGQTVQTTVASIASDVEGEVNANLPASLAQISPTVEGPWTFDGTSIPLTVISPASGEALAINNHADTVQDAAVFADGGVSLNQEADEGLGTLNADAIFVKGVPVPTYPQTAGERAAGITPTFLIFPPGDSRRFGTTGNGTADDTAAIQAAITANPGGYVFLPPGDYLISNQLNLVNGCSLYGVRYKSTLLLATQNMNGVVFGDGTSGTRTAASECSIRGIAFNPANGVATFTSGSCVVRQNVFNVDVRECDFFGMDSTTVRLWNAITDVSTTNCNLNECTASQLLNNVVNVSGASGALASSCFYNYLSYNNIGGDALFVGVFIGGLTFVNPTGFATTGFHFHMNSSAGNQGQNVFITAPDWECDGAGQGAYVQQGNGVSLSGAGWIGGGTGFSPTTKLIWFGANASNCKAEGMNMFGGQVQIDGPDCYVRGGNITGDDATSTTAFVVSSTAVNGGICGDIKIQQYITSGVEFLGSPPAANFKVTAQFDHIGANATEITGIASSTNNGPDCRGCTTAASTSVTAAATLPLNFGNEYIQVTGATAITSMTIKSKGTIQAIQAGSGGITIDNGSGIDTLSGGALSLTAFKTAGFICDGFEAWQQVF